MVRVCTVVLAMVLPATGVVGAAQAAVSQKAARIQGASPGDCVEVIRDYMAKRRQEIVDAAARSSQVATNQQQLQKLQQEGQAMARQCAARFDVKTAAENDLAGLAELYVTAGQYDLAKAAVDRALPLRTQSSSDRAKTLATAVTVTLRVEPKSEERNARLETMADELDRLPDEFLARKFGVHISLNSYYRGDDIDAGIIKHSTWIIEQMKKAPPEMRKNYGASALSAYINMSEALAGQGQNDRALELLRRAPAELPEVADAEARVADTRARYQLVGTAAAPITAPRWLNAPADMKSMPMTGAVTLLEFTAHWCGPCRESYPGINRLRQRFEAQGFRVVLATRFWGYFDRERNLSPEEELKKDQAYFGEHHLDVPVAVGDQVRIEVRDGKAIYLPAPDPNDQAYKVGGIPQIQLIDRQGKIRLIMVGYDDANEEKLAKVIEELLKG